MITYINKLISRCVIVAAGSIISFSFQAAADQVDDVLKVGQATLKSGQKSQVKIEGIADQTDDLLQDYKQVNKEIEGLRVYNAQLEARIRNQLKRMNDLDEAMSQVTVIQRQITPLLVRMLEGLEQFVAMDVPFDKQVREESIAKIRNNLEASNQTEAEKFRQVLELYKIENEYGRKIKAYEDSIDFNGDGEEIKVDMFQVGRIALLYKTEDGKQVGRWSPEANNGQGGWEALDASDWATPIQTGIRIARNQAVKDILQLPVSAPETAQ